MLQSHGLLDPRLAAQSFHNVIRPDSFDAANRNFMFGHLPYVFGSGCCFITGTNVMVRTVAAWKASKFYDPATGKLQAPGDGLPPQLLNEQEISEDIELGSRIHAGGWKGVLINENLATGEVWACRVLLQRRICIGEGLLAHTVCCRLCLHGPQHPC